MATRVSRRASELFGFGRRVVSAHRRAFLHRTPLAPGRLALNDQRFRSDIDFLLELAAAHGPIFRIWSMGEVTTCIVGHATGRRFLTEHLDRLLPFTVDMRPLYPHGTLRSMQGDVHRTYRRKFVSAFSAVPIERHRAAFAVATRSALDGIVAAEAPVGAGKLRAAVKEAITTLLLLAILGMSRESPAWARVFDQFERFGPDEPIDNVDQAAIRNFGELRGSVLAEIEGLESQPGDNPQSLLAHMVAAGPVDDTMVGNLIQITQVGRYDVCGLLMWLLRFLASAPDIVERIRNGSTADARRLSNATVLETLRLAQSEYLMRRVTTDLVFDGFLIPRGTLVRICILEGHRDAASFDDPTAFLPDRFLGTQYPPTSYAPFGLDHHRCVGADWTVDIGTMFAETVARDYRLDLATIGPPTGGPHHFEPGHRFSLRLARHVAKN